MNVALRKPPPRDRSRPPRAPANNIVSALGEQLPLLIACAALVVLCAFAIAAAHGQPAFG